GDFATRLCERLALLQCHDGGQVLLVCHAELEPAAQDRRAFLGGQRTPSGQGPFRRRDRSAGLLGSETRNCAQLMTVGGIVYCFDRAAVSIDPTAIDVTLLTQQAAITQRHRLVLRISERQARSSRRDKLTVKANARSPDSHGTSSLRGAP